VGEHPGRAGDLAQALAKLRVQGIAAVVSVLEAPLDPDALRAADLRGLHLRVYDCDAPEPAQLEAAVRFIGEARAAGESVLVHCFAGIGRSATVACAYLISQGLSADDAIEQVRRARSPFCVESSAQQAALLAWEARRDHADAG